MSDVLEIFVDGEWLPLLSGEGQAPVVNGDYAQFIRNDGWQALGRALLTHSRHGQVIVVPHCHPCRIAAA